jgi:hypothetical protein
MWNKKGYFLFAAREERKASVEGCCKKERF